MPAPNSSTARIGIAKLRNQFNTRAGLLLAVLILPVIAVVGLGWRIAAMDTDLQRHRVHEQLETFADLTVSALGSLSASIRATLASPDSKFDWTGTAALVIVSTDGAVRSKGSPIPFVPIRLHVEQEDAFDAAEAIEFQQEQPLKAAEMLQVLTTHPNPSIQAGALTRLARNLVKAGRTKDATLIYEKLRDYREVSVGGLPAEFVAISATAHLFESTGQLDLLRKEADQLSERLRSGQWRISRASYEYLDGEVRRWLKGSAGDKHAEALAAVVDHVWRGSVPEGQELILHRGVPVSAFWSTHAGSLHVFVTDVDLVAARIPKAPAGVRVALTGNHGQAVYGTAGNPRATRDPSATGLLWGVHVAASEPVSAALSPQTRLLFAALALMLATVAVGGYFTLKAIRREIVAAQTEAQFVAAVSHEFLTPITSLLSMSELLAGGRVAEDRRTSFYQALIHDTQRLQRLVEGLLQFGKLDAQQREMPFEPLDLESLLNEAVKRRDWERRIELSIESELPLIQGDSQALLTAFYNLLDNAVKYSPPDGRIGLTATLVGENVEVSVRDEGRGIAPGERDAIFRRFYRGTAAQGGRVPGTGIGLSLVAQIAAAHNGNVRVESAEGKGSTFTVRLPADR